MRSPYRQVNWNNFQLGGHDGQAKVKFVLKEKPDRRDNCEEARISNATAAKFKNNRKFESLSPEQQAAILEFFK